MKIDGFGNLCHYNFIIDFYS
ncbi:MAG: hypothetical protein EOM50_24095 [Erysipelotrichia bacterium]|nr:hypothetical protein [Erysipelotrichia bacterium]